MIAERVVNGIRERGASLKIKVHLRVRLVSEDVEREHVISGRHRELGLWALGFDVLPNLGDDRLRIAGGVIRDRGPRVADDREAKLAHHRTDR